ncbi:hypothetical protein [Lentzea sp. NPDC059081]|uniref:hypothetical protein n=1 Tax=Lentzea sp. NPDC059081 TaxID=3346719 RepID=UPI003680643A
MTCAPTCPTFAAATATQQSDAEFFVSHPHTTVFWRAATWVERSALIVSGIPPEVARTARVRVTQLAPGHRLRAAFVSAVTK